MTRLYNEAKGESKGVSFLKNNAEIDMPEKKEVVLSWFRKRIEEF